MFKKIGIVFAFLLVLVVGGLVYVNMNLNGIVERAIEHYGALITKTSVDVDGVDISLRTGQGKVGDIEIGNPKSYITSKAITVADITLKVDTRSIPGSGPIIIKEINVESPLIIYELNAKGGSNLQDLQKNVSGSNPKKADTTKSGRKVIIRDLYIRNGKVTVAQSLIKGREVTTQLPLIHLRNLGKEGEGSTGAEITKQIMSQVTAVASKAGSRAVIENMPGVKEKISDSIKSIFGK